MTRNVSFNPWVPEQAWFYISWCTSRACLRDAFVTMGWFAELLVALIYFPLIVSIGAGSSLSPRLKKLCQFSGDLSYPLYMTHYWALRIFGHYDTTVKPSMREVSFVIIGGVVFLIFFAYMMMRFFEIPVRRYLNSKTRVVIKTKC